MSKTHKIEYLNNGLADLRTEFPRDNKQKYYKIQIDKIEKKWAECYQTKLS